MVDMLILKGADIMLPPDKIKEKPEYRQTPFTISAAMSGDYPTLLKVLSHGGSLSDSGTICLSKQRKNLVISNVIGAAAWAGKAEMLKRVTKQLPKGINLMALEQPDKFAKTQAPFKREYHGYTPLMLAVTSKDSTVECVKVLLGEGADFKCKDDFGNTVLHLAAVNGNNKMIEFIAKNLKIDIFERNKAGETALGICET